jgi:hypothetical protein
MANTPPRCSKNKTWIENKWIGGKTSLSQASIKYDNVGLHEADAFLRS